MTEESELLEAESVPGADEAAAELDETAEPPQPREPMPPIESRFMFVDIAALRAKQLRRGALPRVTLPSAEIESDVNATPAQKLERIAMAELDEGLIVYQIPDTTASDTATESETDGGDAEQEP